MSSQKWKDRLLSSSLPLEYDCAKILSKCGYLISYDYAYSRVNSEGVSNEFSIDISAIGFLPMDGHNKITAQIDILVECKFRDENKKWVFLPDVNDGDYSDLTLGGTTRNFPAFSKTKLNVESIYNFEEKFEYGFKGVEINTKTGEVFDKDIKHGLSQLKYGLPYKIQRNIIGSLLCHKEDIIPFFILPILVTNAELYILENDFGVNKVKDSDSLENLSKNVPYLVVYDKPGPDFETHHQRVVRSYDDIKDFSKTNLNYLESIHSKFKDEKYGTFYSPIRLLNEFRNSVGYESKYSQYIVCNIKNLDELINNYTKIFNEVIK